MECRFVATTPRASRSRVVDDSGPLLLDNRMIRAAIDGVGLAFSLEEDVAPCRVRGPATAHHHEGRSGRRRANHRREDRNPWSVTLSVMDAKQL